MKPIDPDKTEIALGNNPMDVRATWHSLTNDPELELRLAKEYWLKTIQPYISGRKLHGVEFYIAADAYRWLRMMRVRWVRALCVRSGVVLEIIAIKNYGCTKYKTHRRRNSNNLPLSPKRENVGDVGKVCGIAYWCF